MADPIGTMESPTKVLKSVQNVALIGDTNIGQEHLGTGAVVGAGVLMILLRYAALI